MSTELLMVKVSGQYPNFLQTKGKTNMSGNDAWTWCNQRSLVLCTFCWLLFPATPGMKDVSFWSQCRYSSFGYWHLDKLCSSVSCYFPLCSPQAVTQEKRTLVCMFCGLIGWWHIWEVSSTLKQKSSPDLVTGADRSCWRTWRNNLWYIPI